MVIWLFNTFFCYYYTPSHYMSLYFLYEPMPGLIRSQPKNKHEQTGFRRKLRANWIQDFYSNIAPTDDLIKQFSSQEETVLNVCDKVKHNQKSREQKEQHLIIPNSSSETFLVKAVVCSSNRWCCVSHACLTENWRRECLAVEFKLSTSFLSKTADQNFNPKMCLLLCVVLSSPAGIDN